MRFLAVALFHALASAAFAAPASPVPSPAPAARMTAEDFADAERLPVSFDSSELVAPTEDLTGNETAVELQTVDAIRRRDAAGLRQIVQCPVCLECLHPETLATTKCGHAFHLECLELARNRCPTCRTEGPHEHPGRPTVLRKVLEVLDREGVIPKRPAAGLFSRPTNPAEGVPRGATFGGYMTAHLKAHFRMVERIVLDGADALVEGSWKGNLSGASGKALAALLNKIRDSAKRFLPRDFRAPAVPKPVALASPEHVAAWFRSLAVVLRDGLEEKLIRGKPVFLEKPPRAWIALLQDLSTFVCTVVSATFGDGAPDACTFFDHHTLLMKLLKNPPATDEIFRDAYAYFSYEVAALIDHLESSMGCAPA